MSSSPLHDIDFCCWGPFTSPTGGCTAGLPCNTVVDCSFSPNPTETCTILNALPGQFYNLLITNFSNLNCQITFSQTNYGTPGAGTSNCNIVVHCSMSSLLPVASACDEATNTFSINGIAEFSNPPPSGTMVFKDITAVPPVLKTFTAPFVSPTPFQIDNIPCDGRIHTILGYFSDSASCVLRDSCATPPMICPIVTVTGGGEICNDGTSTAGIQFNFHQGSPPFNFYYSINGVPQTPVLNYNGPFPYQFNTMTAGIYKVDSVRNTYCLGSANDSAIVTVHPLPVLTFPDLPPVCLDTPPFPITGGSPPGGTYGGTGVTGGIFNPSATGVGLQQIYYSYTDIHGCSNRDTATILVHALPSATAVPAAQQMCSGGTAISHFQSSLPGSTYSWTVSSSSPDVSGFSPGTGDSIHQALVNTGAQIEQVVYHITATKEGCPGPGTSFTVTVYPVPGVIPDPLTPGICSSQTTGITLTSLVNNPTFSWTATGTAGVTGYGPGNGNTISQILTSNSGILETVTYQITVTANGCPGPAFTLPVLINPQPHLMTNPMYDTICSGTSTNIHLLSSCLNTTYTWTATNITGSVTGYSDGNGSPIVQKLYDMLTVPGDVRYTIRPEAGTCIGNDTNYYINVKPKPQVQNTVLNYSVCSGFSTNIPLTSDVSASTFTWTATGSSPNVSGFSASAGSSIVQTLVNAGYSNETVIYRTAPHANGCTGDTVHFTVTVYPVADVTNSPLFSQICSATSPDVALTSHVSGALFTWTATPTSGNVTGYASNAVPAGSINDVLINNGNTNETVTYHITPTANACTGTPSDFVVTVYPVAHVTTSPLTQTICTQTLITVPLTATVANTTFAWTATPSSPNLGGFSDGTGSTISQTLTNSGYSIAGVTYNVTPTANGCTGVSGDYIVTVNPKPDVSNNPLSSQVCSETSPDVSLTSNVSGATFSWTATPSSGNVTGYGPGSGLVISQVLTNSGFNVETVTYNIIPAANSCPGTAVNYIVSVVSVPDVYFNPTAQTICTAQSTGISLLSHVNGALFSWTATGSSPSLSGFGPGSGNTISQPLQNSGTTIESVTYQVTPTAFGCPPGFTQPVIVTVNPKPAITNTTTAFQICNQVQTNIVLQSSVAGSNYSWTVTGSSLNVGGYSAGNGQWIRQTLTNSGFNVETVTYNVIPTANSCNGDAMSFTVTVIPVADAYFTPTAQAVCSGVSSNIQVQSHVSGTSFTWTATGSSGNVSGYYPNSGTDIQQLLTNAGYNIESVTYNVTPTAAGCTGTMSPVMVTVNPLPVVTLINCWDPVMTTDAKPFSLKGGSPFGGIYAGTGVNAGVFSPQVAGEGVHSIQYLYINDFGCNGNTSQTITVIAPLPFTCGDILTDIRDNQQYPTVNLNGQCWMASDLNYGTEIQTTLQQRDNCVSEKYINPSSILNPPSSVYQWDELMRYDRTEGSQGLCPGGWHVPSEAEWLALLTFYGGNGFAGSPLKSTGYSGFDAMLDGALFLTNHWDFNAFATLLWSSTAHGTNKAWAHGMNQQNPSVSYYPSFTAHAFGVRCLKD